jgi:hypothetical protein
MTEARTFIEFRPGMRRLIEDAIESLILLLDEIDGDDDLEDGGDDELEPDREHDPAEDGVGDHDGWCEQWMRAGDLRHRGAPLTREEDATTSNLS